MNIEPIRAAELVAPFWTIVVALLATTPCAMLGCYLVLRRMSLLGDAISHSILPGIAIAFLVTGSLASSWILVAAVATGILTAVLAQALARAGVTEDSSLGVVFTALFALGVLLISAGARQVDLDPGCVLYGTIELAPIHTFRWGGLDIPVAVVPLGLVLVATIAFVILFWKELALTSFDPALATSMGIDAGRMHYFLLGMVAVVTVAAFEQVGSILVVAMLIVPAATAQLLVQRLGRMMVTAVAVGGLAAILGYAGAAATDTSVAGMMAVAAGLLFLFALLFARRGGLVRQAWQRLIFHLTIAGEDVLATLFRFEERSPTARMAYSEAVRLAGGGMLGHWAVRRLCRRGELDAIGSFVTLTVLGRARGQSLVRAHRLWEAFLDKNFDLPLDHLHESAERFEHYIGPGLEEQLAAALQEPGRDPHGRPIPAPEPSREPAG